MLSSVTGVLATAVSLCLVAMAGFRFARREYPAARKLAGLGMLAACLSLPLACAAAVVSAFASDGDESKATVLARGISSGMNADSPSLITGLAALIVWSACVYRMRSKSF